jgi:hypothetical protein
MICRKLDELEGNLLQARVKSQDVDSLGWRDREFSCLHAISGSQAGRTSRRTLYRGLNSAQEQPPMAIRGRS